MDDRKLTDEERDLWKIVTKDVSPLEDKSDLFQPLKPVVINLPKPNEAEIIDFYERPSQTRKKKSKRYEAVLDLHGMTRDEAHKALETFLCTQKMRGTYCALVITGKGHGKGEGFGVLKRKVPLWLKSSKMVKSFVTAAPKDGGDGALYVYLK